MPRLASGPYSRTHGVRPSEKTAFSVVPRSSLPRPSVMRWPRRGGAGSARPQGRRGLDRGMCPLGHRLIVNPSGGNGMPRLAYCLATRTHGVRPSEKNALRVSPGFSPQGHPTLAGPPHGGAGSARPLGRLCLHRAIAPLGHRAFVCPR
jgi:hypothetical protein